MLTILAALPLAGALLTLLLWRWPAARAAALGCGLALLLMVVVPSFRPALSDLLGALADGLVTTVAVVAVVFGGLLLFQVMDAGGAIQRIAKALGDFSADRTAVVLLLVLGWAPLVESASGFGVGAAVTCPLLLALGLPRQRAIMLSLLGLCVVPWGALAVGLALGVQLAGVPFAATGAVCAVLCLPVVLYFAGLALALAAGRDGWRRWPLALTLALTLGGVIFVTSGWLSVELAGLLGGLAALMVGLGWVHVAGRRSGTSRASRPTSPEAAEPDAPLDKAIARRSTLPGPSLPRAMLPYLLLISLLLATRLIAPVARFVQETLVAAAPGGSARLPLLANAGVWLLVAAASAALVLHLSPARCGQAMVLTGQRWWRPALATLGFVTLGQLMLAATMTAVLADVLTVLGPLFLPATALLGAMGGYVTGSNAGANGMLATLCAEAARQVGLSPVLVAAMLNAAAANVTMASAPRLLLAVAVAGGSAALGQADEARLTRQMAAIALGATAILVALGMLLVIAPGLAGSER